jgi:N-acetylmuramoyl-L-alanine amidase
MRRMFHPAQFIITVLLLVLAAGCGTPTPRGAGRPPDVDLTPQTSPPVVPSPEPAIAPARTAPPAPPPAPAITLPPEMWIALGNWAQANKLGVLTNLGPNGDSASPRYAFTSPRGTLKLQADSQLAQWNGLELRLGYNPRLISGWLHLHTLDVQKNLLPLLADGVSFTNTNRLVVIDAGHGGKDGGTRSVLPGKLEKDYALDWALRLKPLLEAQGWRVLLTRTNDIDLPLPVRVSIAEAANADLFLSLHFNAATGNGHAGVETYCLAPFGMPSNLTRGYEDNTAMTFPNNRFDAANLQVALRVHREVLAATGGPDRGVRRARFLTVLRGQNRPAVLIEGGYLSNATEAALVDSPEHRQKLAEAIARALP